jgi:hypothetical protein
VSNRWHRNRRVSMEQEKALGRTVGRARSPRGQADQSALYTGAQQLVLSAHEYAEFVQLSKKMDAMQATLAA